MKRNIVISFSGGRTSALMSKLLKEDPAYQEDNLLFAFANTGKERPETLDFVDQCDREFKLNLVWLEADVHPDHGTGTSFRVVDYPSASRNGEPFEAMIRKYGISNKMFPHCTRELKIRPIHKYARRLFGSDYVTAIGIRFDEMVRTKPKPGVIYPMVEKMVTVTQVRDYWNASPFDLRLKDYEGNCDLCWKKSLRKQMTLLKEHPSMGDWWHEMEQKYSHVDGGPHYFFRGNASTQDLIRLSQQPFTPVTDPYWRLQRDAGMDSEMKCACMDDADED